MSKSLPKKAPSNLVSLRLTDEEYKGLASVAETRGTTRHNLLRQVVRALLDLPTTRDVLNKTSDWIKKK